MSDVLTAQVEELARWIDMQCRVEQDTPGYASTNKAIAYVRVMDRLRPILHRVRTTRTVRHADNRLIAAAPDLLSFVCRVATANPIAQNESLVLGMFIEEAQELLAKAREQQL